MAKQRGSDKVTRVLRFLLGLRNRRVAEAMAAAGLRDADIAEVFALFPGLTRAHVQDLRPDLSGRVYEELRGWLARWRPILLATLGRHAPARRAELDAALVEEGSPEVLAVLTVIRFLDELAGSDDGRAVRAILASRGLTDAVLDEARRLGEQTRVLPAVTPDVETEATFDRAERAMWAWYLEWSAIARAAVRERSLRRALGFSPRGEDE